MKNLLFGALLLAGLGANAQNISLDAFYNKYKDQGSATNVEVGNPGISLSAVFSGHHDMESWAKKVKNLQVLIMDAGQLPSLQSDLAGLDRSLHKEAFEELMTVRSGKDHFRVLMKEEGRYYTDVVLLAGDQKDFIFVRLQGKLTREDVNKLQSSFQHPST